MKALTVRQPWAWAIVYGQKTVENRTQSWSYRGPLAIHAAARWAPDGGKDGLVRHAMRPYLTERQQQSPIDPAHHPDRFVFGHVIGVVDLVDVHQEGTLERCCESPWAQFSAGPFNRSPFAGVDGSPIWHLVLANPRPVVPVAATGRLGLWKLPSDLRALNETR